MIREILTSQPQQTLQHINPSHQDEPFQSLTLYIHHTMNPKLASIGSSNAISIINTTFGCTLK